jgi:tetratricopeptide (TPR) repeat protein
MNVRWRSNSLLVASSFGLVLTLTWLAYRPGLSGGFLFDDFINLPVLGYYGSVDNWKAFWLYVTSGSADPTGRPLALLSFLIDANDWPADPYAFKRTGVLLHMLNGALLTWLLVKLGRASGRAEATAAAAAVLGAALWLLHPLMLSTTLYIVQRETVLAGTFVLLGLLGYVGGRELALRGAMAGVWLSAVSIVAGTLLAILCKANGALLPALALVTEIVLLAPARPFDRSSKRRGFALVHRVLLVLPSILLGAYLAWKTYSGFVDGMPSIRAWTLGERLLTESRILIDYLGLLWLPRAFSAGLFNDHVSVSTGLFSPWTTSVSTLAIGALLAGAWRLRKRHPAPALAILFFFIGHLLESTVVPLELYFEHRNYLPAALMFWPLALWICGEPTTEVSALPRYSSLRKVRGALAVLLPLVLASLTWLAANLWGNVRDQALVWAARNPESPRAQVTASQIERAHGETSAAIARLQHALERRPLELQLLLNLIGAKCEVGTLTNADIERTAEAFRKTPTPGRLGGDWFIHTLSIAKDGSCPGLTLDVLDRLLDASVENPRAEKMEGRFLQEHWHIQAQIALVKGDDEHALTLFDDALDADPRPDAALEQAAILASAGQQRLAQRHLDHFTRVWQPPAGPGWTMPSLHSWLLWKTHYWDEEIAHMRETLAQDIAAQAGDGPPSPH